MPGRSHHACVVEHEQGSNGRSEKRKQEQGDPSLTPIRAAFPGPCRKRPCISRRQYWRGPHNDYQCYLHAMH